jgi:hypothetical protein
MDNDPHIPDSCLPTLLNIASRSPLNQPLLKRTLIDQLLDNATLSNSTTSSHPRATGKSQTTTALIILQLKQEIQP